MGPGNLIYAGTNQMTVNSNGYGNNPVLDLSQVTRFPESATGGVSGFNPLVTNLSPTSVPGMTNRLYGTNLMNSTNRLMNPRDQAFTPADRAVLSQLRQQLQSILPMQSAGAPVVFVVRNGIVTLRGTVPNPEMRQSILSRVQQVPGVLSVQDQLTIGLPQSNNTAVGGTLR
jgi:osmotically-inducible protein OsmY